MPQTPASLGPLREQEGVGKVHTHTQTHTHKHTQINTHTHTHRKTQTPHRDKQLTHKHTQRQTCNTNTHTQTHTRTCNHPTDGKQCLEKCFVILPVGWHMNHAHHAPPPSTPKPYRDTIGTDHSMKAALTQAPLPQSTHSHTLLNCARTLPSAHVPYHCTTLINDRVYLHTKTLQTTSCTARPTYPQRRERW